MIVSILHEHESPQEPTSSQGTQNSHDLEREISDFTPDTRDSTHSSADELQMSGSVEQPSREPRIRSGRTGRHNREVGFLLCYLGAKPQSLTALLYLGLSFQSLERGLTE